MQHINRITVVLPFYNEDANVEPFFSSLLPVLDSLPYSYEIIAVNDGSTDETGQNLRKVADGNDRIQLLEFIRNYGQTAALQAGFDHASGDVIVTMDTDLQNDPKDIPRLLDKLVEGYDVVSGWRKNRHDEKSRVWLSKIANALISRLSGVKLHDYGCTLKAYRRESITGVKLYGEMHRFIPIYTTWRGAKVTEAAVTHHPRKMGKSKYGFNRIFKVLLDIFLIRFMHKFFSRPIYIYGMAAFCFLLLSGLCFLWAIALKIFSNVSLIQTPLPLICIMSICLSIISLLLGLMAEVLMRTYFESQKLPAYVLRQSNTKHDDV